MSVISAYMLVYLQEAKVVATMVGHTDRVNCVQWLPVSGESCKPATISLHWQTAYTKVHSTNTGAGITGVVASGAADNHVIIWLSHPDKPDRPWSIASKLQVRFIHYTRIPTCN